MTKNANIFKNASCTLSDDLLANLLPTFLRFGLHSFLQCYEKILKLLTLNLNLILCLRRLFKTPSGLGWK